MNSFKLEYYQDDSNDYRWRLVAGNGDIVADSAEGYKNKKDCKDIAEQVFFRSYLVDVAELW